MVAPLVALFGWTLVTGVLAPDAAGSPQAAEAANAAVQQDAREWKFSDGKRQRAKAKGPKAAPLPARSLQRAPIAPAGAYQGLRLDSKTQPPIPVVPHAKGAPVLTWVGFQRDAANEGVVFVQVDQAIKHQFNAKNKKLKLFLPGVQVTQKNHTRSLDLRYFPQSNAKHVRTKVTKKGTTITITLRSKSAPVVETRSGPEGQHQILVRIPAV